MFGSSKKNGDDLPGEEWNFAEILEEDTEACLLYELAREIEHPELYFSVFASRQQAPFALAPMSVTSKEDVEASAEFKQVREAMYIRPFEVMGDGQEVVGREMFPSLYFLHADGSFRGYPAFLRQDPWLGLDDDWQGNLQLFAEQFLTGITFHSIGESQQWEQQYPGSTKKLTASSRWRMLTIKVDWSKNDSALTKGFTAWLEHQRPKEFPSTS